MIDPIDITAVYLCAGIYGNLGSIPAWDFFDDGSDDGICWGVIKVDGLQHICFRGSVTAPDWFDDFEAIAVFDPVLQAYVHPGFNRGIWRAWQKAKTMLDGPWVAEGHSLGAARADNMTAYAVLDNNPPVKCVVFGEPKPGFADFAALVAKAPRASYRNMDAVGHDIVPDVPVRLLVENYKAPSALIDVTASPAVGDQGLFIYHHIGLYQVALRTAS